MKKAKSTNITKIDNLTQINLNYNQNINRLTILTNKTVMKWLPTWNWSWISSAFALSQ